MATEKLATLTTGMGSLPFVDVDAALAHVFTSYDIPFFPQLPRLSTDATVAPMLAEILTPGMLAAIQTRDGQTLVTELKRGATNPTTPLQLIRTLPAYAGFISRAQGHKRLKAQIVGPHTAHAILEEKIGTVPALRDALRDWIACLSIVWGETLRMAERESILLWDEGSFIAQWAKNDQYVFRALQTKLAKTNTRLGIHTCTPGRLDDIAKALPATLYAFDLSVVDVPTADGVEAIYGVVDTRSPKLDLAASRKALQLAHARAPKSAPLILSGGCGTGLHTETYEMDLAAMLRELAAMPRVVS